MRQLLSKGAKLFLPNVVRFYPGMACHQLCPCAQKVGRQGVYTLTPMFEILNLFPNVVRITDVVSPDCSEFEDIWTVVRSAEFFGFFSR